MVANGSVSDNLVSEDDQTQVVDILTVVLLNINSVHVHQDVSDHHHAGLVVVPGAVQGLEEVVVEALDHVVPDLAVQVVGDHLLQPTVQSLPVLVQHHGVRVPVQFFKRQTRVILLLNFLKIKFLIDFRFKDVCKQT